MAPPSLAARIRNPEPEGYWVGLRGGGYSVTECHRDYDHRKSVGKGETIVIIHRGIRAHDESERRKKGGNDMKIQK